MQVFLEHLDNAINAHDEIPVGIIINKEASRNIGNGLQLTVHSSDHDTHFHIVHKERGNDARFAYPSMQFLNYKREGKSFTTKQIKNITSTCLTYADFIEATLNKRPDAP